MKNNIYLRDLWNKIKHKKILLLSIVFTTVLTQGAFLLLPIITQTIIDKNINNITNYVWYETNLNNNAETVNIKGVKITQNKRLSENCNKNSIINYKNNYYLIKDFSIENNQIVDKEQEKFIDKQKKEIPSDKVIILHQDDITKIYNMQRESFNQKLLVYLLIVVLTPITAYISNCLIRKFSREISADFRINGIRKLFSLPMSYFDKNSSGKFISYLIQDISMFYNLSLAILINLLQALVIFIGVYIVLFFVNIKIFLFSLILIPIIFIWFYLYRYKVVTHYETARSYSGAINALLNEQFQGQSIIKAFNNQKFAYEEFVNLNEKYYEESLIPIRYRTFASGGLVNIFRRSLWIFILIYSGLSYFGYIDIAVTSGCIFLLISLVNYYTDPIYQMFGIITMLEQANVSIKRYLRFINEADDKVLIKDGLYKNHQFEGKIFFKNVSFSYNTDKKILKKINLYVEPNTRVAIVGHTGSGKSSMMNLLLRFYDDYEGDIYIDDINIKKINKKEYRRNISVILQYPSLFKGTLKENITWGDKNISDSKVVQLLTDIGADNLLSHEKGIYQDINIGGGNLSVGQRQQIAFARAIINNPSLLILDEATANIDTYTERLLQKALFFASKNRTTFIIAHRLSTIKNVDKIIVLDNGSIIEEGNHDQLLSLKGKYFRMYNSQMDQCFNNYAN